MEDVLEMLNSQPESLHTEKIESLLAQYAYVSVNTLAAVLHIPHAEAQTALNRADCETETIKVYQETTTDSQGNICQ
jgi:hypothetical protein